MAIILKDTSDDPNKIVVECNGLHMFNNCLDLFVVCKNDNNNEVVIQLTETDKNHVRIMCVRGVYGFSLVKGDIKAGSVREFFLNFNDDTCYLVSSDATRKDLSNVTPNPPLDWIIRQDIMDGTEDSNWGWMVYATKTKNGVITVTGLKKIPAYTPSVTLDTTQALNNISYSFINATRFSVSCTPVVTGKITPIAVTLNRSNGNVMFSRIDKGDVQEFYYTIQCLEPPPPPPPV
jgi:hypothetical protein